MIPDRSSPSRVRFASLRALDRSGPILGDSLFMRERGELQRGGISTRTRLHNGIAGEIRWAIALCNGDPARARTGPLT